MCYLCNEIKTARGVAKLDAPLDNIEGIDEEIIYRDFSNTGSPYTYILKIWELNKDRLCGLFQLQRMMVNHDQQTFHIQASQASQVKEALHCVTTMLHQPVLSFSVDPNEVIVMRILKAVKKEFSNQTGCWLHFKWPTRTVSIYGLDGEAASQYINTIMEQLRTSLASGGPNTDGLIITEQVYDRRYKTLIKKYVGYIEAHSGAQLVIKKDDPTFGQIIVQFYGIQANIQRAQEVISEEVLVRPVDEAGPCPAKACSPGEIVPPDQFTGRQPPAKPGARRPTLPHQPSQQQHQLGPGGSGPNRNPRQQNQQQQQQQQRQPSTATNQPPQSMFGQQQQQQQQQTMNPFFQQPMAVQKQQTLNPSMLPYGQQSFQQSFQQTPMMPITMQPQAMTAQQFAMQQQQQQMQQMQQMQQQALQHELQKLQQTMQPQQPMPAMQPLQFHQLQAMQPTLPTMPAMPATMSALSAMSTLPMQAMSGASAVSAPQQDQQQMVFVNVNGVPYPVVVVPDQANAASSSQEPQSTKVPKLGTPGDSPRAPSDNDSQFDSEIQGMLSNSYTSLDRQMLLQVARMRGPKMQLFNSLSMPNLPLSKGRPEMAFGDDPFSGLDEQEYQDLMKQTQQQMKAIYQVVNGAGVDLKWVVSLLREISKSKLDLRAVIEMLENAATVRQFSNSAPEFTVDDKTEEDGP
jgi:hypothetical protein